VERLLVNTGTDVRTGTAMATVSSPDYASAVSDYRKAEDASKNAQRILKLDEQLFQNDALARSDLDQARTDASQASADVDAAVQQLRSLGIADSTIDQIRNGTQSGPVGGVIRSPIPGVVVEKLINPGQLLAAGGTPTFTVADLSTMWVMASVYPSDIGLVHEGEAVSIYTDASPKPVSGRVDYVADIVDPGTKATSVRVLADNAARELRRDMFVRLQIHSSNTRKGLVIPASAMLRDEDNLPFVFVTNADGSFARRRITYGYRVGDGYEVTSGRAAGEHVLTDGALFIQFAESQ
jgi:cobalt-zinc-cadmium efflux system membrane fusion protein